MGRAIKKESSGAPIASILILMQKNLEHTYLTAGMVV